MKTQNPWMGRMRGSAGNMTGCKVYDKNVLRAKAFEVSNPDTAAQQTQRDFFKEVAAIVATVSEEELRSLFGIKPMAMSRRNALSKQVASAFSVDATGKHVDFSKLQAIGNGKKVTTDFFQIVNGQPTSNNPQLPAMFGMPNDSSANVVLVLFDTDNKNIKIVVTEATVLAENTPEDFDYDSYGVLNGFGYMTCAVTEQDISSLPFGSFTLKTRSVGKQVEPTPPTLEVTIYSGGTESGNFFHFDGSLFDESNGDQPTLLLNGSTEICDSIQWDEINNWWFGTTSNDIDISTPLTLNGTINGESVTGVQVDWVVQ